VSSKTTRAIQRNPVSKNKKTKQNKTNTPPPQKKCLVGDRINNQSVFFIKHYKPMEEKLSNSAGTDYEESLAG
jgi:hypothetical protein